MSRSVRATKSERNRWLPGDGQVLPSIGSVTHAITLQRTPDHVWPWLVKIMPRLPNTDDRFVVLDHATDKYLVLGVLVPGTTTARLTWSFVLEPALGGTRLIVRVRAAPGFRYVAVPRWLSAPFARFVHFVMERRQLLGIARSTEALAS